MDSISQAAELILEPQDNERLANLCGQFDEHLRQVERSLGVEIKNRGNNFWLHGDDRSKQLARVVLNDLYDEAEKGSISAAAVHLSLQKAGVEETMNDSVGEPSLTALPIKTRHGSVKAIGANQLSYINAIVKHDISFSVGPAGTGKTYLAVACAVDALEKQKVQRILLVRPAVEAGERLGFLPGDLAQKIDPYLRPLYDALYEMLGNERVAKLIERNVIEVAPLAYMRGRTLNEAFVILDEAQNTTMEQMRMFLTRIGFGSKVVINGDVSQVDLPRGQRSGLRHAVRILRDVEGISFTHFGARDVVRHPLVQRIVNAYESHDSAEAAKYEQDED